MKGRLIWPIACLVLSGCTAQEPVPLPVDRDRPVVSPTTPPQQKGDIALWTFPSPLSVADASSILMRTNRFAYGRSNGHSKLTIQGQAFNTLFDQADSRGRFSVVAKDGTETGQLYSAAAFTLLDPQRAVGLVKRLQTSDRRLFYEDADVMGMKTVKEFADLAFLEKLARTLRQQRKPGK